MKRLFFAFLFALSGCPGPGGSASDATGFDWLTTDIVDGGADTGGPDALGSEFVAFDAPADGSTVEGSVHIKLVPVGVPELEVQWLQVTTDGGTRFFFGDYKLPTDFVLDTRQFPNGTPVTFEVKASLGEVEAIDTLTLTPNNPSISLVNITPDQREVRGGDLVTIRVKTQGPVINCRADFSAIDSTYVAGSETTVFVGDDTYEISHTIGEGNTRDSGLYIVPVTAQGDGENVTDSHLRLRLQALPTTPVRIDGALYVPETMPASNSALPAPNISATNTTVVTGGSTQLQFDMSSFANPGSIVGLLVGLSTHSGYFQIPLDNAGAGLIQTLLKVRPYAPSETAPQTLPLVVAARDEKGRVSNQRTLTLTVVQVGTGDIQVNVSWDNATDIDLHVVEPGGCELYWGNKSCGSGAFLDLDSNVSCDIDGVNNENAYWPAGAAPPGEYIVRVDFYEDCCACGGNYAVTVNTCGKTEVFQGSFNPNTATAGGEGAGTFVTSFSTGECLKRVRGRVRYEDRPIDEQGFGASSWLPVRFALVELRRLSDGALVGRTVTDIEGFYEVPFQGDNGSLEVIVKARTADTDPVRNVVVMNHPKSKILYEFRTPSFVDAGTGAAIYDVDFDITEADGAGVFNIFDVLVAGYDQLRSMIGSELGLLNGFWVTGADTTDTLYCSQYFYDNGVCSELGSLSIQGKQTDRDEYDDMIILRQLFKFAIDTLSRDDNPGGLDDGTRDDPRRAWVEGVSTFFASDVLGTDWFVNSAPSGVFLVQDLEHQLSPFAYRTSDGAIDGDVSPLLISAVLRDLADGTDSGDPVDEARFGIYDSVFQYLPSAAFSDRGVSGVDFVDFLDGWACRGWGERAGLEALVVDERKFPYDFASVPACGQ